ncbi:hypothetical protein E3U23_08590 [Erythrobacter litoralis]|uniref:endonuclease/exonuclease/phosphatase family protein n=1 Tax=Erythrobacter litoralis TaxID=39960 RepID=UPI002435B43D|nr:endonuclease/exonuclease/phosphatase family protein [Erythrobacter litoralis]MDG6079249.1 hypothetical protein [Erythrobacter litoralis]
MKTFGWRGWAFVALGLVMTALALVSLWPTNRGLVRVLDFVREPSIYLAALLGVLALFFAGRGKWLAIGLFGTAALVNFVRIWPYSLFAPTTLALTPAEEEACVRVLSFNVKQANDQYDRTAALIRDVDPDILFLTETNRDWLTALQPELARYPNMRTMPLENRYGKIFATRLAVENASMVANTSANTPTLYATLRMPNDARFELVGLHPRPPRPGESSESRDENIARAGSRTPDGLENVLVIGDFNDVPWSRTTTRFREEGDFLDPRAGRGTFATFPVPYTLAGWPLDQLLVRSGVHVSKFERGPDVGSDHLPLIATVCVDTPAS